MKFLTRLGQIALQVTTGINTFGPIVQALAPASTQGQLGKVLDTATQIAGVVAQTEVMGQTLGLSGPDKLKAAVPVAMQIFLASDALIGHKVKDVALFKQGVEKCVGGWADIMNSLDTDKLDDKK